LNGPELASLNPSKLVFFALIYVPDPREHESFAHLFRPEWVRILRNSVRELREGAVSRLEKVVAVAGRFDEMLGSF